ncbi:MAG: serine/threonine-protein kinase [Chlamydiae bacterium]|nr:serine/threonine-protein kinase [Chlamydiota bacterium]
MSSDLDSGLNSFLSNTIFSSSSSQGFSPCSDLEDGERMGKKIDRFSQELLDAAKNEHLQSDYPSMKKQYDELRNGHEIQCRSSVKVLIDTPMPLSNPLCRRRSFSESSLEKKDVEKQAAAFIESENRGDLLKKIEYALQFFDTPDGAKLPTETYRIVHYCLKSDGKEVLVIHPLDILGAGAQGKVFSGVLLQSDCAIKQVFNRDIQFIKEYNALVSLKHPHIIALRAVTKECLIFPLAKGSLAQIWKNEDPQTMQSSERLLNIIEQITEGLSYLHSQGYVHRDIKPGNIFIDQNDNILIGDLGLTEKASVVAESPTAQCLVGTLKYLPLEALSGKISKETAKKRDVWALGIMIWELLAKDGLFHPCSDAVLNNPMRLAYATQKVLALDFEKVKSQLDPEKVRLYDPKGILYFIMKSCLEVDPNKRASMSDIHDFIEIAQQVDCHLLANLSIAEEAPK